MQRMKWIPALRLASRQVEIINRGFILACTHTRAATDIYLAVAYQWYCVTGSHGRLSMCSTIVYIPPSTSSVPLTTVLPGQSFLPGCADCLTFAAAVTKIFISTGFHGRLSMCSTIVHIPPSTSSVPLTTVLPGQSFLPGCVDCLTFAAAVTKNWPWFHETEPRPEIVDLLRRHSA